MTTSARQETEYRLHYRLFDAWFVCGFYMLIVVVTIWFAFSFAPPFFQVLFLLVSAVPLFFAINHARIALRLPREKAWYVSFQRDLVRINFFDYSSSGTNSNRPKAVFEIQGDQLIWIRKVRKKGYGQDDADSLFIEMQLTDKAWAAAKERQTMCRPSHSRFEINCVELLNDNILRVSVGRSFQGDLISHFRLCEFPLAPDYEV